LDKFFKFDFGRKRRGVATSKYPASTSGSQRRLRTMPQSFEKAEMDTHQPSGTKGL
jgi:hypothetical protein